MDPRPHNPPTPPPPEFLAWLKSEVALALAGPRRLRAVTLAHLRERLRQSTGESRPLQKLSASQTETRLYLTVFTGILEAALVERQLWRAGGNGNGITPHRRPAGSASGLVRQKSLLDRDANNHNGG